MVTGTSLHTPLPPALLSQEAKQTGKTVSPAAPARRARPLLAIVVPCFNEHAVLDETARRLRAVLDRLSLAGAIAEESFLCFVDDGSDDGTWDLIQALCEDRGRCRGIKLSRNFGHQNALLAGLMGVRRRCDCAISIDADLQQDEGAIDGFLDRYRNGAEIVFGVRNDRLADGFLKRTTASLFYTFMQRMGVRIIRDHADFRLLSRPVLDAIAEHREYHLFLRGLVVDMGFRTDTVRFDVRERFAGASKYSFGRMLALALTGITSFSVTPLRLISIAGAICFLLSLAMVAWILSETLRGNAIPGWASTVTPIYFIGGVQLLSLGVLGEYVGKIYIEAKGRPRYIAETELL